MAGKYVPTKDNRFYPGHITEERARQLDYMLIPIEEITVNDIVFMLSRARTMTMYLLLNHIEKKWGEEAATEAAFEFGYNVGKVRMTKRLEGLKKDRQTAEEMAQYQDISHMLGGPAFSYAFCEYDDEKCIITRTQCGFHTYRPEGMKSYCDPIIKGYHKAYEEVDKGIVDSLMEKCMSRGDDSCRGGFIYKKS
jgi:hypothetical protein